MLEDCLNLRAEHNDDDDNGDNQSCHLAVIVCVASFRLCHMLPPSVQKESQHRFLTPELFFLVLKKENSIDFSFSSEHCELSEVSRHPQMQL